MEKETKKFEEEELGRVSGGSTLTIPKWVISVSGAAHMNLANLYLAGGGKAVYECLVKTFGANSKIADSVPQSKRDETKPEISFT